MPGTALELLDRIWDEVKERERQGDEGCFGVATATLT